MNASDLDRVREIVATSADAATVRRVFGDPIEKDGVIRHPRRERPRRLGRRGRQGQGPR